MVFQVAAVATAVAIKPKVTTKIGQPRCVRFIFGEDKETGKEMVLEWSVEATSSPHTRQRCSLKDPLPSGHVPSPLIQIKGGGDSAKDRFFRNRLDQNIRGEFPAFTARPLIARLRGFAGLSRVASLIINGLAEKVFTTARSFRSGWWR
jgi:hypothetical protein